jgi:hypothetical protein
MTFLSRLILKESEQIPCMLTNKAAAVVFISNAFSFGFSIFRGSSN